MSPIDVKKRCVMSLFLKESSRLRFLEHEAGRKKLQNRLRKFLGFSHLEPATLLDTVASGLTANGLLRLSFGYEKTLWADQ